MALLRAELGRLSAERRHFRLLDYSTIGVRNATVREKGRAAAVSLVHGCSLQAVIEPQASVSSSTSMPPRRCSADSRMTD